MGARSFQIKKAFEAFPVNATEATLMRVAEMLEKRPLRRQEFDITHRALEAIFASLSQTPGIEVKFSDSAAENSGQAPRDRAIDFSALYMSSYARRNDILVPVSTRTRVSFRRFENCWRTLPVNFSSGHTDYSYIRKTAEVLDYKDKSFRTAIAFSVALAAVLEREVPADGKPMPCLIPHKRGFFLGHASQTSLDEAYNIVALLAEKPETATGRKDYIGPPLANPIIIRSRIDIDDFVATQGLYGARPELHEYLQSWMAEPAIAKGLDYGLHAFAEGPFCEQLPGHDENIKSWTSACDGLKSIVRSPLWRAAQTKEDFRRLRDAGLVHD